MSESEFLNWQQEARLLLVKKFQGLIYEGSNWKVSGILNSIHNVVRCDSFDDVLSIISTLKNHFKKYGVEILYRGQMNDHNYSQLPSGLRISEGEFEEIKKAIDGQPHKKWVEFLVDRCRYFVGKKSKVVSDTLFPYQTDINPLPSHFPRAANNNERMSWISLMKRVLYALRIEEVIKYTGEIAFYLETTTSEYTPSFRIWEPIMQHYGWRTRWLDLVGDISVAAWFSVYNARKISKSLSITTSIDEKDNAKSYFYIYAIHAPNTQKDNTKEGKSQRLVNLSKIETIGKVGFRAECQSAYSLLDLRLDGIKGVMSHMDLGFVNYNKYVLCEISIDRKLVLEWLKLQDGDFHQPDKWKFLFPNPSKTEDSFYDDLLRYQQRFNEEVSQINTIHQYYPFLIGNVIDYYNQSS